MANILQVLLGLVLVNHFLFDVVLVESRATAKSSQLNKARFIAIATAAAFLLTLTFSTLFEQFVLRDSTGALLTTLTFILILAAVLHGIALIAVHRKLLRIPALGVFLPLIFINCVVIGVTMPLRSGALAMTEVLASGVARCIGFALMLIAFTAFRKRLAGADIPAVFRGAPTTLFAAALLSVTFMGFAGLA